MNSLTKWAIAAAAVVVVAIVGYSLFPSRGGTASQAAASPVVVAAASVAPSEVHGPIPRASDPAARQPIRRRSPVEVPATRSKYDAIERPPA